MLQARVHINKVTSLGAYVASAIAHGAQAATVAAGRRTSGFDDRQAGALNLYGGGQLLKPQELGSCQRRQLCQQMLELCRFRPCSPS